MADQELRDKRRKPLGKIRTLSEGRLELRDASGRPKGTYNPETSETRDVTGGLVGKGKPPDNVSLTFFDNAGERT